MSTTFGEYSLAYWSLGLESSMANLTVFGILDRESNVLPPCSNVRNLRPVNSGQSLRSYLCIKLRVRRTMYSLIRSRQSSVLSLNSKGREGPWGWLGGCRLNSTIAELSRR